MSRLFALLPALSLALSAQTARPNPKAAPASGKAAPSEAKKESPVLAYIGSTTLTQAEVDAFLENLPPQQRMQLQYTPGGTQRMVQELAEMKLVAEKARRMGMEKDAKYRRRLEAVKSQLLTRAFLEAKDAELRKNGEVSDEDVKAYFESHKDKFTSPATFDARHILVGKRPQGAEKDRTEEELQARVKEVQAALAAGKPFEELVEPFSDDPGKANKGLYAGISKGQFVPEFEAAAFAQEVGKVGEPVKTQYGYHLIRVEKRTEPQVMAFDAVKEQAKQQAQQEKGQQVWNTLIAGLKKEIPFKMLPPPAPKPAAVMPAPAKAEETQP